MSHAPLVQVTFTLREAETSATGSAGMRAFPVEAGDETSKFDLSLALSASASGIEGALTCRADLFDRATMERMAGHLVRIVERGTEDPVPQRRAHGWGIMGRLSRVVPVPAQNLSCPMISFRRNNLQKMTDCSKRDEQVRNPRLPSPK